MEAAAWRGGPVGLVECGTISIPSRVVDRDCWEKRDWVCRSGDSPFDALTEGRRDRRADGRELDPQNSWKEARAMRFMVLIKSDADIEAGIWPPNAEEMFAAMGEGPGPDLSAVGDVIGSSFGYAEWRDKGLWSRSTTQLKKLQPRSTEAQK